MKISTSAHSASLIASATLALLGGLASGCALDATGDDGPGFEDLPTVDQDEGKADSLSSDSPDRLVDIPFYFGMPKGSISTVLNRAGYAYPTVWNPSDEVEAVGLRIIAVKQATTRLEDKIAARRGMARSLAHAGVLQDGDVALTFRPELAGTMAYPHIQMGSTHAGLVYTEGGEAFNLDSPLDGEYVGQFDTKHYAGDGGAEAGTTALHILRPAVMNEARRAQLRDWVSTLRENLSEIRGERGQLKFQSDYMKPIFVATGLTTRQTVTKLGQIILEEDTATKLPMYCAEFVWHMIALSNCSDDEIRSASADGAACVDEPFAPMAMVATTQDEVGLAEGPLFALLQAPGEERGGLVTEVFADGSPSKLSSGHRAVAEQVAPLMGGLAQLFQARAAGASPEQTAAAAAQLNAAVVPNYSPTAFMVQAMPAANRSVEYVATVAFVSPAGYEKAKVLSQNPVP